MHVCIIYPQYNVIMLSKLTGWFPHPGFPVLVIPLSTRLIPTIGSLAVCRTVLFPIPTIWGTNLYINSISELHSKTFTSTRINSYFMYMCRDHEQPIGVLSSDDDESMLMAMAMPSSDVGDDDVDQDERPTKCRRGAASGDITTSETESDDDSSTR
jgi:hypothetical protein